MKSVYFQLVGGAAGDMLLASLVGLGCPLKHLKKEFNKLNIKFSVKEEDIKGHFHTPRKKLSFKGDTFTHYKDIVAVIESSGLDKDIKENALRVYSSIANVEKKVHKATMKNLHFHHLGEIDAILEICGFFIALKYLRINKVYCSAFPVACPAPATLQLLKGRKIYAARYNYETITPTAAALLKEARQKDDQFSYKECSIGWGQCRDKDYLVAYLFEERGLDKDPVIKIETNIDDMNPQLFETLFDVLYKTGAKEVYLETVLMKKMRPAYILNVLCYDNDLGKIRELLFKYTTTFGIRYQKYQRDKVISRFLVKKTKFGKIRFRVAESDIQKQVPEYEDCKKRAKKFKIPLVEVYRQLAKEA
ncbi:MAG: DUF111 family protein [Candidatus Omnitrophica bacterium]|nr:DUF111 family protein [Candidatus Omnitrophota bacterium]